MTLPMTWKRAAYPEGERRQDATPEQSRCCKMKKKSQRWESNPQPPHYECGALPIEATLAPDGLTNLSCKSVCGKSALSPRSWTGG